MSQELKDCRRCVYYGGGGVYNKILGERCRHTKSVKEFQNLWHYAQENVPKEYRSCEEMRQTDCGREAKYYVKKKYMTYIIDKFWDHFPG